jgi:Nucleoside-diphosphate-sugar pyrophosphorylase involved in lipopolysaccharide biosynthesis/translation initiation factor 2B, gamma/epsilon subunits (eIF-2Bgamma/eIF-2Bepsilon)
MVPVAGVPLIESTIRNFVAAGISRLSIIVNEQERDCAAWVRARFAELDLRVIVKTTASSLESFREVAGAPEGGRMLVSTVDAWCRPVDFARFVSSALRRPREATVLAVTPLVDDEKPLGVTMDAEGRVTALGVPSPALVTAGVYLVSERARRLEPPPRLGRLREHLGWLLDSGEPMFGEVIETVVDVDRAEDVALAESLAAARLSR